MSKKDKEKDKPIMEPKYIALGGLIFMIMFTLFYLGAKLQQPQQEQEIISPYEEFATCLAESGAKMYGTWWCGHCNIQKEMFEGAFSTFEEKGGYIECSPGETRTFSQECIDAGIEGTPTWTFAEGEPLPGRRPLETLSERTGCELP